MYIFTLGHGGGTIKRKSLYALLLAIGIVMCIFPFIGGTNSHVASSENAKIGLDEKDISEIDAAGTIRLIKYKKYKKPKKKYKKTKKTYKKAKATYIYKKLKVRYKYRGKWRTKWVYKRYKITIKKTTKVSRSNVGAKNVVVTSEYVYATARCSCSLYTDYNYHTRVFCNYNPRTNHWGVLKFEQGPAPKTSPEGLWVATDTDMDFCLVHGRSHDSRNVYLTPYNGVINGINVVNGYFTTVVKPDEPATNTTVTNSTNLDNSTNNTEGAITSNDTNETNI